MIHAHIKQERAVPLWAAVGAPLLGIPLMVALLAFLGPTERPADAEPGAAWTTEQLEVLPIDRTLDFDDDCIDSALRRG